MTFNSFGNYEVTVTGVVTADTSDIPGGVYSDPMVHIQDGTGQWCGVWIFGTESYPLVRGDRVTVTGTVNDVYGYTRIGNVDQGVTVTLLESNVAVPEPTLISTQINATPSVCESYEGVLIKVQNVTVTAENADGSPGPSGNYGEMAIADDSGINLNVLLDGGGNTYHNFWDASLENQPIQITTFDTFEEIIGILYYSYSEYKMYSRKNDDFVGHAIVGIEEIDLIADSYQLSQNYPNPFNPTTKIQFSIPQSGHVRLNVYNTLGQRVMILADEYKNAGSYSVDFNASNLPSGVYFYEISANDFRSIKKMMLVK